MARHKIRYKILLKPRLAAEVEILASESLVNLNRRLAHHDERVIRAMLGRYLQLARNVVADELFKEGVVLIVYKVIKSYSRTDKDLFDTRNLLHLGEHVHILAVIYLKILTRGGGKALSVSADTTLLLLLAGGVSEVCGRSSDVVYVSLEIGH